MKLSIIATLIGTVVASFVSSSAFAENTIYLTPYIGYSFSNQITDENGIEIRPESDPHAAIAIETDMDLGRVGLFVSHQPNEYRDIEGNGSFTYVHLQSSLRFDALTHWDSFFGASLGATIVDAEWSKDDLLFSAGLQGGLEYHINNNTRLVFEARWLANLIDGDTSAVCQLPTGSQTCLISIDSEWLSQLQTNVGVTFSF
ncbi:hypothetical protein ACQKP8_11970 [Photobacterium alginatilyticum]|uniref:hypothetical protein n=1 Tax=Photobacterium alginatilyticum TaxID=1775171 RepID=UPI0040681AA6